MYTKPTLFFGLSVTEHSKVLTDLPLLLHAEHQIVVRLKPEIVMVI